MQTISDVLQNMEIEGNIVKMPQLDRKLYLQVVAQLETLGGKWNKKAKGIVFSNSLSGDALRQALLEIDEVKDLRKKYQFFETPKEVARKVIEYAEIKPFHRVLEPSAGRGALIEALFEKVPSLSGPMSTVDAVEIWDTNVKILLEKLGKKVRNVFQVDFLKLDCASHHRYDRIIANPPFSGNQDIDHVRKMYDHLTLGGRLVAITSTHWAFFPKEKKCEEFREWLIDMDANVYDIESDSFEYTKVATKLIVIDKNLYPQ